MIRCTKCHGEGSYEIDGPHRRETVTCQKCKGLGAVDGPQEERLIEALNKIAEELGNLRHIAEREERSGGYRQ